MFNVFFFAAVASSESKASRDMSLEVPASFSFAAMKA
jgi:hypothetical protein